jgi:hypothetical protein
MNLTDLSTRHWPSAAVAVALVALFGLISIARLPIQLLPNIEQPQVSIRHSVSSTAPASGASRPPELETHNGDFIFVAWERNEEFVDGEFELFDRLSIPFGRYSFDR